MADGSSAGTPFDWTAFLTKSGISQPDVNTYAALFKQHGVDETLLEDLDSDWLQSVGINDHRHQRLIIRTIKNQSAPQKLPHSPSDQNGKARAPESVFSKLSSFNRPVQRRNYQAGIPSYMLTRSLLSVLPSWAEENKDVPVQHTSCRARGPSELLHLVTNTRRSLPTEVESKSSRGEVTTKIPKSSRGEVTTKTPKRTASQPFDFLNESHLTMNPST
jgi:hypothetical protein